MSKQRKTAGKTAKTASGAVWRTVIIKGKRAMRSPDGRIYYGTAAEVRDANLYPWERDSLADDLRASRLAYAVGNDRRDALAMARCNTLRNRLSQFIIRGNSTLAMDRQIMAIAAARYLGISVDDFINKAVDCSINAAMEDCRHECGKWLPLTKHEALAIKSDVRQWCESAQWLDAVKMALPA